MDTDPRPNSGNPDDELIRQEEDAAAAEAARIGGRGGLEEMDEAERASAEYGGGVAEGFEQSEELLERQASHADTSVDPLREAPAAEEERDPSVNGEADKLD